MLRMLVLVLFTALCQTQDVSSPPEYPGLPSIKELVGKVGASTTNYLVSTDDGYMIWMHRVGNSSGPPVLVQHGLFNAADLWVTSPPEGLVYMLLEEGYDVYLGNQRGNAFALYHRQLDKSEPSFWDWSFHEGGYYDLPAMIDQILKIRRGEKIMYIGYSLGTTVFFVMGSTRPEYNKKIKAAILLAPVSFGIPYPEMKPTIKYFVDNAESLLATLYKLGLYEVGGRASPIIKTIQAFCGPTSSLQALCLDIIGALLGEHRSNIDKKTLGYHVSFSPAGSSLKTLDHLNQLQQHAGFHYMDYGPQENLLRYNSTQPPAYKVSRISCPVALFWGKNDNLLSASTVNRVASLLPNLILKRMVPDPKFTHFDFLFGINAKKVLYNEVILLMKKLRH